LFDRSSRLLIFFDSHTSAAAAAAAAAPSLRRLSLLQQLLAAESEAELTAREMAQAQAEMSTLPGHAAGFGSAVH